MSRLDWITDEMFDQELRIIVQEEGEAVLLVPGVYEVCAEHFNNEVLDRILQTKTPPLTEAEWDILRRAGSALEGGQDDDLPDTPEAARLIEWGFLTREQREDGFVLVRTAEGEDLTGSEGDGNS